MTRRKKKIKIRSGNSSSELISFASDEFPKIKVAETDNKRRSIRTL